MGRVFWTNHRKKNQSNLGLLWRNEPNSPLLVVASCDMLVRAVRRGGFNNQKESHQKRQLADTIWWMYTTSYLLPCGRTDLIYEFLRQRVLVNLWAKDQLPRRKRKTIAAFGIVRKWWNTMKITRNNKDGRGNKWGKATTDGVVTVLETIGLSAVLFKRH